MAFLCSQLQVAVETQTRTRSCWNTDRRCRRMLPPPSGHAGQNRTIVLERPGGRKRAPATLAGKWTAFNRHVGCQGKLRFCFRFWPGLVTGNGSSVEVRLITRHVRSSTEQETHQADATALK